MHALLGAAPGHHKVLGVNEWLTPRDFATILAQVLGKRIEFVDRNPEFDMSDPELARDHAEMMGFIVEFGYDGGSVDKSVAQLADLGVSAQLAPVKEWCAQQDWTSFYA